MPLCFWCHIVTSFHGFLLASFLSLFLCFESWKFFGKGESNGTRRELFSTQMVILVSDEAMCKVSTVEGKSMTINRTTWLHCGKWMVVVQT